MIVYIPPRYEQRFLKWLIDNGIALRKREDNRQAHGNAHGNQNIVPFPTRRRPVVVPPPGPDAA